MKKQGHLLVLATSFFLLASCGSLEKEIKPIRDEQAANQTVTTGRVDHGVYQGVLKDGSYQTSSIRGLTAGGTSVGYNQKNFEAGLLKLSKATFPTDVYYFHEGSVLNEETVLKWLGRESKENPEGLNAENKEIPLVFQQAIEYDFFKEDGESLSGLSLGLSFTRYDEEANSTTPISQEVFMKQVRKTVNGVLSRVRKMPSLEKVPIIIGIFEQAKSTDINGGHYIYSAVSKDGEKAVDLFDEVEEAYITLPVLSGQSNLATEQGLAKVFQTFKSSLQKAFPQVVGVTGKAHYLDKEVESLVINLDSKYFSQTEIDSLTQFVGKQIESLFEEIQGSVEIQIQAVTTPQAYVGRKAGEKEIISYQFD